MSATVATQTAYGEEDLGADAGSLTPADPGNIPLAITLTIYGHHFRRICELYIL